VKKRYLVIAIFVFLAMIMYIDKIAISAVGTSITGELGIDEKRWGLILAAYSLGYGLLEIPVGMMVDKFGPKITLIRIVIWWSFFTLLTGFASGFYFLIIVRFLFGAGEAGAFPTVAVAIARWFPVAERARAQSVVWMGTRVGSALAPILSIMLAQMYGWRMAFYVFSAVGFLWVVIWWLWFKDEPRDMKGISAAEVETIEKGRTLKTSTHAFLPWKTIFGNSNMWALMAMYHFLLYGAYFYMSWMPKYLENGRHIPKSQLGFMVALPFIIGIAGCFLGGFASDFLIKRIGLTLGRRYVGMFGLLMAGVCMIMGSFIQNINIAIIFLSLGLAFKDFTLPVSWAVATDIGGKNAGTISGAMGFAGHIGSAIMASAFGFILQSTGSYEIPVRLIGCFVIVGGLLWFKIDASKPIVVD
jgi:sugar phosphate permease